MNSQLHSVENMVFDTNTNSWVSAREYCSVAIPPKRSIITKMLVTFWGIIKFLIVTAFGFGIAAELFMEYTPWYSRLWSAITGTFPFWPF